MEFLEYESWQSNENKTNRDVAILSYEEDIYEFISKQVPELNDLSDESIEKIALFWMVKTLFDPKDIVDDAAETIACRYSDSETAEDADFRELSRNIGRIAANGVSFLIGNGNTLKYAVEDGFNHNMDEIMYNLFEDDFDEYILPAVKGETGEADTHYGVIYQLTTTSPVIDTPKKCHVSMEKAEKEYEDIDLKKRWIKNNTLDAIAYKAILRIDENGDLDAVKEEMYSIDDYADDHGEK